MAGPAQHNMQDGHSALERRAVRSGGYVELGVEPPIESDGASHSELDRRRVSVRWLVGTVLTGFAGASLIGASIYAALDPQTFMAETPEVANIDRTSGDGGAVLRKGDRLMKSFDIVAARQTFRTPTTVRVGDREIVRQRTFTRVATTLGMNSTGFADDVPAFNPLKLLAGETSQHDAPPEPEPDREDADVSFITRDIADAAAVDPSIALNAAEVQAQVAEHVRASASGAQRPLPLPPQLLLMRTSRAGLGGDALSYAAGPDPGFSTTFSSIEVRMVPENVTMVPKADPQAKRDCEEKLVVVRRSETLRDILTEAGSTNEQIQRILDAINLRRGQSAVSEGQKLRLMFCDLGGADGKMQIARISFYSDDTLEATVARADSGQYVQVARADSHLAGATRKTGDDEDDDPGAVRLYNSFYQTALKQEVPKPIIDDLVRIFANDVDFQRSVSGGDSFEAFYEESEEGEGRYELLYASITARSETFRYYRYQSPEDGTVDFFDPQGRSTRKFLIRKPIATGQQRSGFGMRRHPILRYKRMHTGVDWAAPMGTPIVAAGNGTVIKAARESGYGNRVEIQHGNGYITTYNHMSGFARGMKAGIRVRQGQVVGFLGSTGLSTGPHLHYEVIVNGNFVDPLRIRLARTRELSGKEIAEFRRERERIDELIARAPYAARFASRQTN